MNIGHYVDPAVNYEHAAQAWAARLNQPFTGGLDLQLLEALFTGVYPETMDFIEADPQAFGERVAAYRHNLALQHQSEE